MKSHLILVLSLTFLSVASGQGLNLGICSPVKNEHLRRELLDMKRAREKATNEFPIGMCNGGVWIEDDVPQTTIQTLILRFHTLKEYCLDRQLSHRLEEIVDEFGWPGRSLVGKDGATAAASLVISAVHDGELQKRCLTLMNESPRGEVNLPFVCFLTDQLLVAEGKKQKYGTEYGKDLVLEPIEDIDSLDKRRKAMGLGPIDLQLEFIKLAFLEFQAERYLHQYKCTQQENSD